jgi:outer membrane receptor protein involved in Fe transport
MLEVRFEPRLSNSVQLMTRTFANVYDFDAHQSYTPDPMVRPSREQYLGIWFGGEARVVATPWRDMRISAGLEVQHHPVAQLHGEAYDDRGAAQPYLDTGNQAYSTAAAYALAEATVTRWFRFSAAARLDYFSFLARPAFNPRLALIFRPWAHGVLKVLGGSAFRAPSLYERLYNDGGNLQPIAGPLVPETVYSGEVEYSHRVADNWVALGSVYANYIERIVDLVDISIPDPMTGMPRDGIQYQNRAGGVVTAGGDVEVRREWRYGWMLSAMYGYLYARYVGANAPMDTRVINAPEHFASFRGVVPLIPGTLNGALRMTVEAPRRISLADETAMLPESERDTPPAVIADLVLSGGVPRYGVRYAAGLYNLFDWRYDNPVATGFSSRVMPQNGRSLMVQLSAEF